MVRWLAAACLAAATNVAPASVGAQLTKGVGKLSAPEIEGRITRYYEGNPDRRAAPVIGVLWQEFGRPRP